MSTGRRLWPQIVLAGIVLLLAAALAIQGIRAMQRQYSFFEGCWGAAVFVGPNELAPPETFFLRQVERMEVDAVTRFFLRQTRHLVLLYIFGLAAIIGWSASVFYRVVLTEASKPDGAPAVRSWGYFVSSFALSLVAAGVLFLMYLIGGGMAGDDSEICVSRTAAYSGMLASLVAGVFVLKFFNDWLKEKANQIWDGSLPPGGR